VVEVARRFGDNLVRCRKRAGFSQEELAFRASIHRTQIGVLERGGRCPRIDTLVKLAGALDVSVDELLDGMAGRAADDLPSACASPGHPAASGRVAADRAQPGQGGAEAEGSPSAGGAAAFALDCRAAARCRCQEAQARCSRRCADRLLAYAGLRPQEALALRWGDVRERTLLVEKAADGQGGVKATKTGQARTVRLLVPLADDLAEWRCLLDQADDDALLFPNGSGGIWNDPAWQTWHRDAWVPACRAIGLEGARPYDLRHSFVSLLIHEGRSVVEVARQAGHSPTMTLDVYAHVFDEFDVTERVSAEDQIAQARRDVSGLCPPISSKAEKSLGIPGNPYNPSCLPRISFMISSVPPPMGPRRASRTARSMPYSRM
jgi:DNA-binding XRE family transcriptional regulator